MKPSKWTSEQDEYLRQHYGRLSTATVATHLGRSVMSVQARAGQALKLDYFRDIRWTEAEVETLKRLYPLAPLDKLLSHFPHRPRKQIKAMAKEMKLRRLDWNRHLILGKLDRLIDGSPTGYYWLGFLLADGHFAAQRRLRLTLAIKDLGHLKRFGAYIGFGGHMKVTPIRASIAVMDRLTVGEICRRFSIQSNKTENPPPPSVFDQLTDDQFVALLIGFIDGDGSIRLRSSGANAIAIKCHGTWLTVLNSFLRRLNHIAREDTPLGKLNARGYARIHITKQSLCRYLRNETERLQLPVLDRKWSKINPDRRSKYELRREKERIVLALYAQNVSLSQIAVQTGISYSIVGAIMREQHT